MTKCAPQVAFVDSAADAAHNRPPGRASGPLPDNDPTVNAGVSGTQIRPAGSWRDRGALPATTPKEQAPPHVAHG